VRAGVVSQPRDVGHTLRIRLAADYQPRRALGHIVVGRPAKALDDRARLLAAERPQLPGKDERFTRQAGTTRFAHGVPMPGAFTNAHRVLSQSSFVPFVPFVSFVSLFDAFATFDAFEVIRVNVEQNARDVNLQSCT
jgi:hypothetical protein